MNGNRESRGWMVAALLLAAVVALVYAPGLRAPFIHDDHKVVVSNPLVRSWSGVTKLITPEYFLLSGDPRHYRPIGTLSHIVTSQVLGDGPWGHHAVNVVIHLVATVLVLWFVGRLTSSLSCSFAAALWFGLHPGISEAVLCVTFRRDALILVFGLGGLAALDAAGRRSVPARPALIAASALMFGLALGTKETSLALVALLPPTLAALRGQSAIDRTDPVLRAGFLSWIAVAVLFLGLRLGLERMSVVVVSGGPSPTLWQRLALMPIHLVTYVQLLVWPWPLAIERPTAPVEALADARLWLSLVAIAMALGLAVRLGVPRLVGLGLAWVVVPLAPALLLVAERTAERYLYVSAAGAALLLGLLLERAFASRARAVWAAALAIGLALETAVLRHEIEAYVRPELLWTQTVDHFPANYRAWLGLAAELFRTGRLEQAAAALTLAAADSPDADAVLRSRATLARARGRWREAFDLYREYLVRRTVDGEIVAIEFAAMLHDDLGLVGEALAELEPRASTRATTFVALGRLCESCGLRHRAREAYRRALALAPDEPRAFRALKKLPFTLVEPPGELALRQALAAGEDAGQQTHLRRAAGFERLGRIQDAISEYRRELAARPGNTRAAAGLAALTASGGR